MSRSRSYNAPRTFLGSHLGRILVVLVGVGALGAAADAQTCDRVSQSTCERSLCAAPATAAPASLWGELQPTDVGNLPDSPTVNGSSSGIGDRDTTAFNEFTMPYGGHPWFYGIDVENGWVLTGLAHGIGVWDARANPGQPTAVSRVLYNPFGSFPVLPNGELAKIIFIAVDAPAGVDTVAALAGLNGAGLVAIDLSDKAAPRAAYQSSMKNAESVYAVRLGSVNYAFMASNGGGSPVGVYAYDLTAALAFNGCSEEASDPRSAACPGVLLGRIATSGAPSYVHGVGNYLVVGMGSSGGFQIFDISNPSSPQLKLSHLTNGVRAVHGVAMWQQGSSLYVGARLEPSLTERNQETAIFNVSCVATSCAGAPPLVSSLVTRTGGGSNYLTFSRDAGGTPYLYAGSDAIGCDGVTTQREWLLDVGNPAAPHDLTPQGTISVSANYSGVTLSSPVGYWGWYYRQSPSGFNLVAPRAGKFYGDYFFRAARSIFDIHKKSTPSPPSSNFSWSPSQIYPGDTVQFADLSTGSPTSWSWTFPGGAPPSSTQQNPAVTFANAGDKAVSLAASNGQGPGAAKVQTVTVLNPSPAIGGVVVSPSSPLQCQPVSFSATGVTGKPVLNYAWNVQKDAAPPDVVTSSATSFTWSTQAPLALAGNYRVNLAVSNTSGSAQKFTDFALASLPALATSFAPTCGNCTGGPPPAPPAGTASFSVIAAGATEWNWDFGDGLGFRGWTNDPVKGPNPDPAVYQTIGNKTVVVKIRNCVEAEKTSSPLVINIIQTTPLVASFSLNQTPAPPLAALFCFHGACFATVGQTVPFSDSTTGAQSWDYDWDGNGTYEDPDHATPVSSHAFSQVGVFTPKLRVRRGASEQNVATLPESIDVSAAQPPSISVSGSTSGTINQALSFSASASNCTPNASGWNWSTGGGSGSSTSASISITWPSAGSKTVQATNSACSPATGSLGVSISDPGSGTLQANFTFTPGAPKAGEAVAFNASSSTGGPTAYDWKFGDGATASGVNASHVYATPGTFSVFLAVSKPGTGNGCLLGTCISETTKSVAVASSQPPLDVSFSTSANCQVIGGFSLCDAFAGQSVSFTASSNGATSYSWDFGDGGSATGSTVAHSFAQTGSFAVILSGSDGSRAATASKAFTVTPAPIRKVAIAWIAQTLKPVLQTSDLFVNNPSRSAMTVDIFFRKRGVPELNPPKLTRTIPARGTVFLADVLGALFTRPDESGFIVVAVKEGSGLPVVTSFNTTFDAGGNQFGQTLSGVPFSENSSEASTARTWHVVGLNDDQERDSYFGLTNPGPAQVDMGLRFYNHLGSLLSQSNTFSVPGFGQKQFSLLELRSTYKVQNETDWRVEIQPATNTPLLAYGANRRVTTKDPSSLGGADGSQRHVYLLGAIDGIGLQNSLWQSDLVLANPTDKVLRVRLVFSEVGLRSTALAPVFLDIAARETRRLTDVITATFGRSNKVGLLSIESEAVSAPYLIAQGESYNNADPAKRFGQTLPPFYEDDGATAGHSMSLVGLRQDTDYRVVMWVANLSASETATMNLVYRDLAGNVAKRIDGFSLPPGRVKQYPKSEHPSVAGGRFTVEIEVLSGKVIAGAQVVNNKSNDPAYVRGQLN